MNKKYYLMAAVDSDELSQFALIEEEIYDKWNNNLIDTGANDHFSLFNSEHVKHIGSYSETMAYVKEHNSTVIDILGTIAY